MSMTCLECNKAFENETRLHWHFRSHKLTLDKYYQKHFPRHDKLTGELIEFRKKTQYFATSFNSRKNLIEWFKTADIKDSKAFLLESFRKRKETKNLRFPLCQVELRTLMLPSAVLCNQVFGNYGDLALETGLKVRYNYSGTEPKSSEGKSPIVLIDSREQTPLEFQNNQTRVEGLSFGDYTIKDNKQKYFFERKSLADFVMTFSTGFERFSNELERARLANSYLIVLIECSLTEAQNFHKSDKFFAKKVKYHPEYIFRHVRTVIQAYENVQFLFVKNREDAAKIVVKVGSEQTDLWKREDLQFRYDMGQL